MWEVKNAPQTLLAKCCLHARFNIYPPSSPYNLITTTKTTKKKKEISEFEANTTIARRSITKEHNLGPMIMADIYSDMS